MAARGGKSIAKLLIIAGVVCALLVVAAGVLHTRTVTSAVEDQQKASAAYVRNTLPDLVAGYQLGKPLPDNQAKELTSSIDAPNDSTVAIYTLDGKPVYPANAPALDAEEQDGLSAASKGHASNVEGHGALVVFAPIDGKNGDPVAVAAVSTDESVVEASATGPLDTYKTPLMALAAVLVLAGLGLMFAGRSDAGGRKPKKGTAAAGATGFGGPAPAAEAEQEKAKKSGGKRSLRTKVAAEDRGSDEERAGAQEREVAIREALENQLEQLRTQLQTSDERAGAAVREIQGQLAAATKRADEAEARLGAADAEAGAQQGQPRDREMVERLQAMDAQLGQAKAAANESNARAESLEAQLAALLATPQPSADTSALQEQVRSLQAQLDEAARNADEARRRAAQAEQAATESDQRAQSVDSIRGDLEVRIAQLGSKAGELEQKASELETRLSEAHEGGDAVRAEIASLTSALAAANARAEELERQTTAVPGTSAAVEAAEAESSRLRGELALQMERAQRAEERVAALQADVFAAQRGIEELPPEGSEALDDIDRPAFASTLDEPADRNEPVFAQATATVEQAAATPATAPTSFEPEAQTQEEAASSSTEAAPEPEDADSHEDDLWALRERLARAVEDAGQDAASSGPSWD